MIRPRSTILFLLAAAIGGFLLWLGPAGLVTVGRILAYNFSGIEDLAVFPQRQLLASTSPSLLGAGELLDDPLVFGDSGRVRLASLLEANDAVAFLAVQGDRILIEHYFQGYDRATPVMIFSAS